MKILFTGLVVCLLILLGIIMLNSTNAPDADTNTPAQETAEDQTDTSTPPATPYSFTTPSDYRLHAEPDYGYAVALPYTVDVSSPQPGITRYRYVGPNNEADSEITDGYTITIGAARARATTTNEVATQNIQGNRETVISEPENVTIAGEEAVQYRIESELSGTPITKYALLPGNGYEYTVSTNVSPDNGTTYQSERDTILASLQFYADNVATSVADRIVPIAMLDYEAVGAQYVRESSGEMRGCDTVTYVEHVLPEETSTPVADSLEQLFAYERDTVGGWQNFIASQNDTLSFERVEIIDSEARIYLSGALSALDGVCDNPRAAIQIEETALAHDPVDSVQIYLNEEPTDLLPDGR